MKRIIIFGILFAIMLSVSLTVFAESYKMEIVLSDSVNISDEIKQILEVRPYMDTAYKFYNISLDFAFVNANSIEEVFEQGDYVLSEYYVVQTMENKFIIKGFANNTVFYSTDDGMFIDPDALKELQEGKAISQLSTDVEIYARYYLTGETTRTGSAVYYKTNKGDYVYYRDYRVYDHARERYESGNFLFPIKEFCELQKAIYDDMCETWSKVFAEEESIASAESQSEIDESDNANISNDSSFISDTSESYIESVVSDNLSVSNESEPIQESNAKAGMWIAIACGALLLVGIVLVVLRKNKVN